MHQPIFIFKGHFPLSEKEDSRVYLKYILIKRCVCVLQQWDVTHEATDRCHGRKEGVTSFMGCVGTCHTGKLQSLLDSELLCECVCVRGDLCCTKFYIVFNL